MSDRFCCNVPCCHPHQRIALGICSNVPLNICVFNLDLLHGSHLECAWNLLLSQEHLSCLTIPCQCYLSLASLPPWQYSLETVQSQDIPCLRTIQKRPLSFVVCLRGGSIQVIQMTSLFTFSQTLDSIMICFDHWHVTLAVSFWQILAYF